MVASEFPEPSYPGHQVAIVHNSNKLVNKAAILSESDRYDELKVRGHVQNSIWQNFLQVIRLY